jgi:uncharacterized membrane protein HdeD (DUF308 family)
MNELDPEPDPAKSAAAARLARQKRIIVITSCVLIAGGFVVMFFVKRLPLPMRMLVGMTDVVGGVVLIILAQKE